MLNWPQERSIPEISSLAPKVFRVTTKRLLGSHTSIMSPRWASGLFLL